MSASWLRFSSTQMRGQRLNGFIGRTDLTGLDEAAWTLLNIGQVMHAGSGCAGIRGGKQEARGHPVAGASNLMLCSVNCRVSLRCYGGNRTGENMTKFVTRGLPRSQQLIVAAILGAGLLVHLGAGRIEEIARALHERHWIAAAIELIVLAVLCFVALWMGFYGYLGATNHRLVAHTRGDKAPEIDVLILPVSEPKRNEHSRFDPELLEKVCELANRKHSIRAMVGDETLRLDEVDLLKAFTNPHLAIDNNAPGFRFWDFSWTTGFKTVDSFLKSSPQRLRAIHLVPSEDTADDAKRYYRKTLQRLIEKRVTTSGRNCEERDDDQWEGVEAKPELIQLFSHRGVSYERFDLVQEKLRAIIEGEARRAKRHECVVAIDVTGGSSAFSSAAAIEATRQDVIYSYIPPLAKSKLDDAATLRPPECYDVVAESVAAAG